MIHRKFLPAIVFNEKLSLDRLIQHVEHYPELTVQDVYVWLHQSIFCSQVYNEENILELSQAVKAYQGKSIDFFLFEPVGYRSEFIRLNILSFYKYGGPLRTLRDLTRQSKKTIERPNIMQFKTDWEYFIKWTKEEKIPFTVPLINQFDRQTAFNEHLAMPHSVKYENHYSTFYKVVSWELFAKKFPEFGEFYNQIYYISKKTY
jgi:hypothetical protein